MIADELIQSRLAKKWSPEKGQTFQNTFLQHLDVDTRAKDTGLPATLQRMMQAARKYKVHFSPLALSNDLRRQMPIWFHLNLEEKKNVRVNSAQAICLRTNHGILKVGNMWELAQNTDTEINIRHKKRCNCACESCRER